MIEVVPGQGVVEGVEEERVVAMSTGDPAHARHLGTHLKRKNVNGGN